LAGAEAAVVRAALVGFLVSSCATNLDPPEWLPAWEPQLVLLSTASGNRRARPAPKVLQAVEGYNLLCADQNGWAHISTDGEHLSVDVGIP
jgi:hypothetical protein